jgi:hypothetical protein
METLRDQPKTGGAKICRWQVDKRRRANSDQVRRAAYLAIGPAAADELPKRCVIFATASKIRLIRHIPEYPSFFPSASVAAKVPESFLQSRYRSPS